MAFEFFTDKCLRRVQRHRSVRPPLEQESSHYVLIELEEADPDGLERWIGELFEKGLVQDGVRAADTTQAAQLWALREGISESLSGTGLPHKNDIALPVSQLESFCAALEALLTSRYPDFEVCNFGHIGDGNLHVNVMKPDGMEKADFLKRTHALDPEMFELVRKHQGSISAEHGIGLLKKDFLSYSRKPEELALLRAVKRAVDPAGLLNPGKIFD
jgi:FAD/FMN-containing dehydrogenase